MFDTATNSNTLIDGFINEHVIKQGLDTRTEKAYRLDLEHFCHWMEQNQQIRLLDRRDFANDCSSNPGFVEPPVKDLQAWMEIYLDYLAIEKKLSVSTICRKNRVLDYYLSYLRGQGILDSHSRLSQVTRRGRRTESKEILSKKESEAFFEAMNQEYEKLTSEFRKRICLRDMVMMKLLFYHKIEISEVLRIRVEEYDEERNMLTIHRKRGEDYRYYVYSQELREKMNEWIMERKKLRCEGEYYNRMFISKLGKPLSMKMVIKVFDKYREKAGINKGFTPKDLKENCMKQYARELVMERCGG